MKRLFALLLLAFLLTDRFPPVCAAPAEGGESLTLLFTADIHSNVRPHQTLIDGQTAYLGGFARLKTAVDQNRAEGSTLLLDSGDFSMGTMYQTFTETDALELKTMAAIGYDAIALGNHDFEPGEELLGRELDMAYASGFGGAVLCGNLVAKGDAAASPLPDENPLAARGVRNYRVIERGGVRVGVFALMGYEAIEYTTVETLAFADPIQTAKAIVKQLRTVEKVDMVVLLSHCGTIPGVFQEDEDIANAVDGIDVILSGHAHKPLAEARRVNGAWIAGAGTALAYLGKMTLRQEGEGWALAEYALLPLSEEYAEDPSVLEALSGYGEALAEAFADRYGIETDLNDPFAVCNFHFKSADEMCNVKTCEDYPYARLIGDAYRTAIRDVCGETAQVVVEPVGVIRNGLYEGELSVSDVYNALSYGISPLDRSSGAPIALFYLNGSELYDLCETSISLSPSMGSLQMLFGGLRYTYGEIRPILNRVYRVEVYNESTGGYDFVARDESTLYSVAASWTTVQSVSLLASQSMGLLNAVPKDAQGNPLVTEEQRMSGILRYTLPDGGERELKEWYALYHLIEGMPTDENGLHVISDVYSQPGGYMVKGEGGIVNFLRNPSRTAWYMLAALGLVAALIALAAWRIARRRRSGSRRK